MLWQICHGWRGRRRHTDEQTRGVWSGWQLRGRGLTRVPRVLQEFVWDGKVCFYGLKPVARGGHRAPVGFQTVDGSGDGDRPDSPMRCRFDDKDHLR